MPCGIDGDKSLITRRDTVRSLLSSRKTIILGKQGDGNHSSRIVFEIFLIMIGEEFGCFNQRGIPGNASDLAYTAM